MYSTAPSLLVHPSHLDSGVRCGISDGSGTRFVPALSTERRRIWSSRESFTTTFARCSTSYSASHRPSLVASSIAVMMTLSYHVVIMATHSPAPFLTSMMASTASFGGGWALNPRRAAHTDLASYSRPIEMFCAMNGDQLKPMGSTSISQICPVLVLMEKKLAGDSALTSPGSGIWKK